MSDKTVTIIDSESVELRLVKAQLGISSTVRDEYLCAILKGVTTELNEIYGIVTNKENSIIQMFIVDLSCYRYEHRNEKSLPINLQRRLHNLILNGIKKEDINVE